MPEFAPDESGFITALHEIGHALGLKHPFYGAWNEKLFGSDDSYAGTVMTYDENNRESDTGKILNPYGFKNKMIPQSPQMLDDLAVQDIWGPNPNVHVGDTIHDLGAEGSQVIKKRW